MDNLQSNPIFIVKTQLTERSRNRQTLKTPH